MAEGCAFLYLERLLSDLNMLHGEMGKIAYLKKLLALAFAGKEGSLDCVVSEIRKRITALHSLLNKIEHDFQENLGETTSLKELQDTVEKKKNEAHTYLEVRPHGHCAWSTCEFLQTRDLNIRPAETEKQPTEETCGNPGFQRDTLSIETDVQEVPPEFLQTRDLNIRPAETEKQPTEETCGNPGFQRDTLSIETDVQEVPPEVLQTRDLNIRPAETEKPPTEEACGNPGFQRDTLSIETDVQEVPPKFLVNQKKDVKPLVREKNPLKMSENPAFPSDMLVVETDAQEVPPEFLQNSGHDTRPRETEKQHTKASANPGFPRDTVKVETEDVQEVPPAFGRSKKPSERPQGKEGKPPKACEIPAFSQKILRVTPEDLEELPVYMKCRITCDQINAVVNNLNKAMMAKYRIRCQAPSSLNTRDRTLYYRYIREESETREGCPFIVEEDIRLFTSMKMDKRFYRIITILRHFRRLKVIRTSGIILYAMC
ncbi:spindle and kinetochore-associated protein 1-like isoform X1 [Lathamus discolor]|uniref:spindle and kinetochore-associated protein 1-like isoform X1 n=1 Tax=Lathamus discolor TaxID=678569 RepID=UPI0032B86F27